MAQWLSTLGIDSRTPWHKWLLRVTNVDYGLAIVGRESCAYLKSMALSNEFSVAMLESRRVHSTWVADLGRARSNVRSILQTTFVVLMLGTIAIAAEPPNAPSSVLRSDEVTVEAVAPVTPSRTVAAGSEVKPIDAKMFSLALISTGSTFADSYTTLFARQNWLAGKKRSCNIEVQSAYLYGTHPTVGRVYAVASLKSVGSAAAAYYLRKHHSRFWTIPLVANSIVSLQGVTQNLIACN
jgi:hypothetical protein